MTVTSRRLFEPVDAASLAVYRIVFGALMLIATLRFFAHGWIADYYEMPSHFFSYWGFSWVKPWPGAGMYLHFGALAVLAVMIALGLWYRFSVVAFGALFAYAHLIDKTNYLNHYFLVIWLCLVMAASPLHRMWSLDARRRPALRSQTVPAWALWALRAQVALVYVFGGIAKLKHDWLIDAEPMTTWLAANADFPVVGALFEQPWVAYAMSYAGLVFDLSIVPLLLWRRTRVLAYVAVVVFHLTTARLFHLGMFPWIMIASSLLFLPPGWPRRWLRAAPAAEPPPCAVTPPAPVTQPRRERLVLALLGGYFALQVVIPLRHLAYPGDVCWTEEGFRLAWHVMVMEKDGSVELHVTEPSTGRRWEVMPTEYLTRYQAKMMAPAPDMILQLAHIVADDFRARGVRDPEVRVDAFVSLNGRRRARLIDPTVDLARESDGLSPSPWILPHPDRSTITTASRGIR
jgi:vitamin K-dependent gamma-carboxylase